MLYAFVYELKDWRPRRIDKFSPVPGRFLLEPLRRSTGYKDLGQDGAFGGQILQFFQGVKASARTFAIVFTSGVDLPEEPQARGFLATRVGNTEVDLCSKLIWATGDLHSMIELASRFLRESLSLQPTEFSDLGRLKVVADAKGLAVIDTTQTNLPANDRMLRVAQLLALSSAYGVVLDELATGLSVAGLGSGSAAEAALRDWSMFMSAYYFSEPVKQDTIELCRLYNAVKARHKINDMATEATEQLRLLAEIVRLDRTESQAKRENAIQRRLNVVGLGMTLLGLVQMVQLTPRIIAESRQQWTQCFLIKGWKPCLLGEGEVASAGKTWMPAPQAVESSRESNRTADGRRPRKPPQ